jgi:hypothetical protein
MRGEALSVSLDRPGRGTRQTNAAPEPIYFAEEFSSGALAGVERILGRHRS